MRLAPNFCRSFRDEAQKVWRDMSDAERYGISRNEETTTEELLLNLARKHRGQGLTVEAYSKPKEAKEGADWAFWFSSAPHWGIGFRVQAKRLYCESGSYDKLYHQSGTQEKDSKATGVLTPNQCETLLSHKDGLIPIYCFYNSEQLAISDVVTHPNIDHWFTSCYSWSDWGISAASGYAIKDANWGKNNKPGDFPMYPWHYLVCPCCWDTQPVDRRLPNLVAHGAKRLYSLSVEGESFGEISGVRFDPTDDVPSWVSLLRGKEGGSEAIDQTLQEMNLAGIVEIRGAEFDE